MQGFPTNRLWKSWSLQMSWWIIMKQWANASVTPVEVLHLVSVVIVCKLMIIMTAHYQPSHVVFITAWTCLKLFFLHANADAVIKIHTSMAASSSHCLLMTKCQKSHNLLSLKRLNNVLEMKRTSGLLKAKRWSEEGGCRQIIPFSAVSAENGKKRECSGDDLFLSPRAPKTTPWELRMNITLNPVMAKLHMQTSPLDPPLSPQQQLNMWSSTIDTLTDGFIGYLEPHQSS